MIHGLIIHPFIMNIIFYHQPVSLSGKVFEKKISEDLIYDQKNFSLLFWVILIDAPIQTFDLKQFD